MFVRVVVVAVNVGLLQVRSPREGGLLEAERPVHLLLELAVVGSVRRSTRANVAIFNLLAFPVDSR